MQSASIVAQSITIERFPPPPVGALRMPLAERAQSNAVQTTEFKQQCSNNVVQTTVFKQRSSNNSVQTT